MTARSVSRHSAQEPSVSRRHARVRVLLSAKLVTTTDETSIRIRDLSLSGAMVQGLHLPRVGSDIILVRGSFEIFAAVIWCRGDMCGVEFDSPLSTLEELLEAGTGQADTPAALESDAIEAARDWSFPVGRQAFLD